MNKNQVENYIENYFSPDSRLVKFFIERLHTSRSMNELHARGEDFPRGLNLKNRSLNTKKTRILDQIVFQAMANLTFFFEAISLHPELQEVFENDIKNVLGVRHKSTQEYGFMFSKLLRSIMLIRDDSHVERYSELERKQGDFRLRLICILQGIVISKAERFLPTVFRNYKSEHIVWDDLARAWAWTEMLAYPVEEEYGISHRTFDFDTRKLLSMNTS